MVSANIFKENCLVRLKSRNGMPGRRKLPVTPEIAERFLGGRMANMAITDEDWKAKVEKAVTLLSASGKLIACPELQAITSKLAEVRNDVLRAYCNRSGIDDGLYLVKTTLVPELQSFIARKVQEIQTDLVPALSAVYADAVEKVVAMWGADTAAKLPDQDSLPDLFNLTSLVIQFTVPEGLPPEIREAEEKKLRETFEQARGAIVAALWEEFQTFIGHLIERLGDSPDGTRKTFKVSTIDNLRGFCEAFGNRNAFDDSKLGSLVTQAKSILDAVGKNGDAAKVIREADGVRAEVRTAFTMLKAEVDKGVEEVAARSFDFSED